MLAEAAVEDMLSKLSMAVDLFLFYCGRMRNHLARTKPRRLGNSSTVIASRATSLPSNISTTAPYIAAIKLVMEEREEKKAHRSVLIQMTSSAAAAPMKPPEGWTRCHYFNSSKNRFCRQGINPNIPYDNVVPIYCGNHCHLYIQQQQQQSQNLSNNNQDHKIGQHHKHQRIPCPVDPSHHIYANKLQQHLLKCPKNVLLQHQKVQDYYQENVNSGGFGDISMSSKRARWMTPDEDVSSIIQDCNNSSAHRLAIAALQLFQQLFMEDLNKRNVNSEKKNNMGDDDGSQRCRSIQSLTLDEILHASNMQLLDFNHDPNFETQVLTPIQYHRIKVGGTKHAKQITSIIGHVDQHWTISNSPTSCIIIELGAGRAMTGFVTACYMANRLSRQNNDSTTVQLVVIDKSGSRAKADTAMRRLEKQDKSSVDKKTDEEEEDEPNPVKAISMNRIKCDLAHVHIPSVLQTCIDDPKTETHQKCTHKDVKSERNIIALAKHLCGAGSDLALKSLLPIRSRIHSCYLATCCHGLCTYEDYVGRDYLRELFSKKIPGGIDSPLLFEKDEFLLLRRWSSSAVSDTSHNQPSATEKVESDEIKDNPHHVSIDPSSSVDHNIYSTTSIVRDLGFSCGPQGFGRVCQRLIDYGRLLFMKHHLFLAEAGCNDELPNVDLCHYVSEDITPQNALLKGWWSIQDK